MKKSKSAEKLIKQPHYDGGDKAMKEFISSQLRYPEVSRDNGIEGDVHLKYDIDFKGLVTDVKVIGGLDNSCNEEAIRVIKLLHFIVPKIPRNLKVTFHKTITIHFRIHAAKQTSSFETTQDTNTEKPQEVTLKYSYNIVSEQNQTPSPSKVTYSYILKT